jgi:hypothetical protein
VWLKPTAELSFLYGNHVLKAGLGRITEDCPKYQGVVIYNMADVPLGFGVTARSTAETRKLEPTGIVAFHQADVGEYLRDEVRALLCLSTREASNRGTTYCASLAAIFLCVSQGLTRKTVRSSFAVATARRTRCSS